VLRRPIEITALTGQVEYALGTLAIPPALQGVAKTLLRSVP